jgi:thioredoxin-related protein
MKRGKAFLIGLLLVFVINFSTLESFGQEKIKWYTIEEVQKIHKENPKKIFVDVYTDWCGWCKKMDATTFQDSRIIKQLNTNFYAVKLDGEGKENITFKDKTYQYVPQGRRGYHELAAAFLNGQLSYPTTVYLDENLNLIQPIPGYLKVEDLEPILIFLGEDRYKNQTWQEFLTQNYSKN